MKRNVTLFLVYVAFSAALITICSWISIPLTVPFTLQTFAVFTTAGLLGAKKSTAAVAVYIALGLVGLPVFSGFTGGISKLLSPTGGYIIGFLPMALVIGILIRRFGESTLALSLSMLSGLVVCYLFGTAWFMLAYASTTGSVGIVSVLSMCVFPFIIPDLAKMALAVLLVKKIKKHIRVAL